MGEKYRAFCDRLDKILSVICGLLLIVVFFVSVANILLRNILKISWLFSAVLSKMSFVYMVFIGVAVVYYRCDHLKMDFISSKFPRKMKTVVNWMTIVITVILLAVMLVYGINIAKVRMTIPFESYKKIPTGWMYLAVPVGALLMMVFTVEHIITLVKTGEMKHEEKPDEELLRKQEEEIREGIKEMKEMEK
ncbi:MAG: TRAP transporter small permease [Bullifex sp.]